MRNTEFHAPSNRGHGIRIATIPVPPCQTIFGHLMRADEISIFCSLHLEYSKVTAIHWVDRWNVLRSEASKGKNSCGRFSAVPVVLRMLRYKMY